MRSGLVVEPQIARYALVGVADGLVGVQIDLLVFNAFPESFHEHVIAPTPFPVHADLDAVGGQEPRELQTRELTALIGVKDLRCAIADYRVLHRVETEIGGQCVRQPPRQHAATGPVEHRAQIHEAPRHRNVGDIRCPDVIRAGDLQVAQEIRVHRMGGMPLAGVGPAIHGRDAHASHQGGHVPPPNGLALSPQEVTQHPGTGKRIVQMQCVNPAHQCQLHG